MRFEKGVRMMEGFFANYGLLILLVAALVAMEWGTFLSIATSSEVGGAPKGEARVGRPRRRPTESLKASRTTVRKIAA